MDAPVGMASMRPDPMTSNEECGTMDLCGDAISYAEDSPSEAV